MLRGRVSYANVAATVALIVAVGTGGAYAAANSGSVANRGFALLVYAANPG